MGNNKNTKTDKKKQKQEQKQKSKLKLKVITEEDLQQLKNESRCCILINDLIYDVTEFQEHPGGFSVFQEVEGTDATEAFNNVGHSNDAKRIMKKYLIGVKKDTKTHKKNLSTKTEEQGKEFIYYSEEEIESEISDEDEEELQTKKEDQQPPNNYYVLAIVVVIFSMVYYFMFLKK